MIESMSVSQPATELVQQRLLRELYSNHHGWLLGWLRRKLGCPQHAEDLAQDTFCRLLEQSGRGALHTRLDEPRA